MKIRILVLILCALTQGCTYVDDYMLGKDNTPQPKELKEIQPKVKMAQSWATPVGKAHKTNEYLNIKPAIRGDIIYTADTSGLVQAVSKKDGQIKWSTALKNNIVSGPTVANGYVAVGTNASTLVLLNQANGKEVWQNKVSAEVLAPPAISHQKVIAKTIDGKVYAIDAVNGKQLWVADHGAPSLVLKASSSPIIVDDLVLVGFSDGKLDALELQTGRLIWQRSIAYGMGASDVERLVDIDSDPIISNNVAYLATYQGYVGALSLSNGQFIWRKPASVYKNMLLSHNNLYFTDSNDVLWSLSSSTGQVNWKQTSLKARGLTAPALVGGNLAVGDKTGYLHILSTQTGELLGRSQLSGGVTVSPSVSGKNMYVLTNNGMLNQLSVS
ncbi:TPA: outer membrane protein assembly factor BamB [Legionella pneumophila]|nr:outer membrane protein assembly factor BamB [Legionella pneumophila]HAT2065247.1 outer membrane protein assembly factor BamB [Legionella pneumophila]HCR5123183.1 outer membrane protein assembly factor BamB [Legionella pneumophila]HCR5124770.1 outer membrane protein assembly factor BamB [Legionella pneumophila]HCR5127756.1 outer membrane protein assembly factor BamB [Legionella pneumophila]HCR5130821.1 outer membrane protein assembly factor BamB [Legionella pneumophila]